MQKGMPAAIAVWVAAIVSAVVVVHQVEHPMRGTPAAREEIVTDTTATTRQSDISQFGLGDVVAMPMVTIVGHVRGAAEMQRPDDLVIGPGIFTHQRGQQLP
jgi:hypothetical protein